MGNQKPRLLCETPNEAFEAKLFGWKHIEIVPKSLSVAYFYGKDLQ